MARFGQSFINSLTNPAYSQGMFNLGQTVGSAPAVAAQQKAQAQLMQMVNQAVASNDPAALAQASQAASGIDRELSLKLAQAAQSASVKAQEKAQLAGRQEQLATLAESLQLPDLAKEARSTVDPIALRDLAKELRAIQISKVPTQSTAVRSNLASTAGITPQQQKILGVDKLSDDDFTSLIEGQKGDVKSWMTDAGTIAAYRENEFGMVYDEEQSKFVTPSSLGLQQAPPQVQKVEQIASGMADELAKVGAKSFSELAEAAQKAQETVLSIDRSVGDLDTMFTGTAANLKLQVAKATRAFGVDVVDPETIADTEVYIAASASRVADYITNLGAGTGLSDKDLTFAKQVVGGEISADATSLKRMLRNLKEGAERKISTYLTTKERLAKSLGSQAAVLDYFPTLTAPTTTEQSVNWSDLP
mgnify:CR=1 FL=1|tara:strand:+ start:3941 stop:5197 length:1257 start_codon:yes stop_codon:yes gene_type:complete